MAKHKNIPPQPLTPEELLAWAENHVTKDEKAAHNDPFLEEATEGVRLMENPEEIIDKTVALNQQIMKSVGLPKIKTPAAARNTRFLSMQSLVAVAASVCVLLVAGFLFQDILFNADAEMALEQATPIPKEEGVLADKIEHEDELKASESSTQVLKEEKKIDRSEKKPAARNKDGLAKKFSDKVATKGAEESLAVKEKESMLLKSEKAASIINNDKQKSDGDYTKSEELAYKPTKELEESDDKPIIEPNVAKNRKAEEKSKPRMSDPDFSEDVLDEIVVTSEGKKAGKKNKSKITPSKKSAKKDAAKFEESTGGGYTNQGELLGNIRLDSLGSEFSIASNEGPIKVMNFKALDLNDNQNIKSNIGINYFNSQNYTQAHNQFAEVLNEQPNNKEINFLQGLAYLEENKLKKAQKSFEKVKNSQYVASYKGYNLDKLIAFLKKKDAAGAKAYLQSLNKNLLEEDKNLKKSNKYR